MWLVINLGNSSMVLSVESLQEVTSPLVSGLLNHSSPPEEVDEDSWDIHFIICYYCMIPVTILIISLNFPILVSIIFNEKLHFPTFYFVLSLATADLCVGITCLGKLIAPYEASYTLCLVRFAFLIGPVCASVWCMFLIALDRYICIKNPLRYHLTMTTCRATVAIVTTWTYAFLVGFAPLMGWNLGDESARCSFLYVVPSHYVWFAFLVAFTFPLVANVVIYVKIFNIARHHIRKISAAESFIYPPAESQSALNSEHQLHHRRSKPSILHSTSLPRTLKAVKTLAIVLGCFLLTWGPFAVANVVQQICGYDKCDMRDLIGTYLLLLGYCNSFLNPLIYGFWNRDFRQFLKQSVYKLFRRVSCHCCCDYQRRVSNASSNGGEPTVPTVCT